MSCEFEEQSFAGKKTMHKYTCSFSDPHNIRDMIQTKKFQPFMKFTLNLEAQQIKHTGKIDSLIALDAIKQLWFLTIFKCRLRSK